MKGLELSRLFYRDVIEDFLRERYPEYVDRIAAGLAGDGSECYGYDDQLSTDHDWGARICLWLSEGDCREIGEELQQSLKSVASTYMGYSILWIPGRCGVLQTGTFYRKYLTLDRPPQTVGEWLQIPEQNLAAACNGEVFEDPLGEFTAVREELLLGYPEDIRLKKLAARCMVIAQAGQYNYPRMMKRNDPVGAMLAKNEFVRAVISAVYLLNNRYTPFYKWMYHGMCQLKVCGEQVGKLLAELTDGSNTESIIEDICRQLIREFQRQGITGISETDTYMVHHGESIHDHIYLAALRDTDPWMDRFFTGEM